MLTKSTEQLVELEIPISSVSTTQADYGSTTSSESRVTAGQSRTRTSSNVSNERDKASSSEPSNPGFGYQSLTGADIPSSRDTGSRFPSFVNLPSTPSGRFRSRPMENSPKLTPAETTAKKALLYSLNVLNHVLIGFVTIYMSWLCLSTGLVTTALHAWLVTLGFTFLMSEGIMSYYSANVLTFTYRRDTKTTIHWSLQAIGGSLGVVGALIKLFQKGFILTSTHGKLGFTAMFLCLISMLSGLSALYSMRLKHLLSPLLTKTFHNLLGVVTFVIAMIAQFYGYKSGFFLSQTTSDFQDLMRCITILSLALTCIGPLNALMNKTIMLYRSYAQ